VLQPSNADRLLHARTYCSGCQIEKVVDELNLPKQITSCHPSNLPLPDHVDCFVALNGSPSRLEFSEALFGVHSTFDGSMILLENVIQVLRGSVSTTIAQRTFLLTVRDRGAVDRRQSVLITRGCGWDRSPSALRNRRLAASASCNADSRKSMVAPVESMARYK
jgi:hypothetical protein